jgi:hypothetical protein
MPMDRRLGRIEANSRTRRAASRFNPLDHASTPLDQLHEDEQRAVFIAFFGELVAADGTKDDPLITLREIAKRRAPNTPIDEFTP